MLTAEQQQLVADNHNLIYDCLHRNGWDIDEFYDLAAIGLCKAAMAYDPSKGKFTALAYRAMSNEVKKTFELAACKKRTATLVSLDAPIEGTQATYGDMLAVPSTAQEIAEYSDVMGRIKLLKPKQQAAVMLTAAGYTQPEIARWMKCSKQAVWRMIQVARKALA